MNGPRMDQEIMKQYLDQIYYGASSAGAFSGPIKGRRRLLEKKRHRCCNSVKKLKKKWSASQEICTRHRESGNWKKSTRVAVPCRGFEVDYEQRLCRRLHICWPCACGLRHIISAHVYPRYNFLLQMCMDSKVRNRQQVQLHIQRLNMALEIGKCRGKCTGFCHLSYCIRRAWRIGLIRSEILYTSILYT